MKTILRNFLLPLIIIAAGYTEIYAQACTVANLTVKLNSSNSVGANCQLNVDLSWDQSNNSGNKFTNLHLWTAADYPSLTYSAPPTPAQLQNAIGTVVITNPTTATPGLAASYPNGSVTMLSATSVQRVLVSGSGNGAVYRFTIKGLVLTVPGACMNSVVIKGDIWSSNAASDNGVQCSITNQQFVANDPTITGQIICTDPRKFALTLSSLGNTSLEATYVVYADEAPLGTLDASDPIVYTSGTVTIPAFGAGVYTSGPISYNGTSLFSNLWVRVQVNGFTNSNVGLLTNACSALPIELLSFGAQRVSNSSVVLKWETASEQNNKGFEVQRKNPSGNFETIGFVSSKNADGNSNTVLSYLYNDPNSEAGQTQYRLVQVDFDNKRTTSPIVLVKGNNSAAVAMNVVLYPNPSFNGTVTLAFNNTDKKNIILTDISGKVVLQLTGIRSNNHVINGLIKGFYFLKIINTVTNESITEKVIVQ